MKKLLIILIILSSCYCSGCMYVVRYDGDYRGRVFDGDTKTPIEGAAVLAVWNTAHPTPAGEVNHFYDARETLTDKNGEFTIPGMGLKILGNLDLPILSVVKAGYTSMSLYWPGIETKEELDKPINDKYLDRTSFPYRAMHSNTFWPYMDSNGTARLPLRKLTLEERKKFTADKALIPDSYQQLLIKEVNKDRLDCGYKPYPEVKK